MIRYDHVTPTQLAEEAYQASRRRKQPIGPAGLPIPSPLAPYIKSLDGQLLTSIAKRVFDAYEAGLLTPEREAAAAAALHADLIYRFPPADMAVLERHDMVERWNSVVVQLVTSPVSRSRPVALPEPVALPRRTDRGAARHMFYMDLGGQESAAGAPVPPVTEPFFRDVHLARLAWKRDFDPAYQWSGMFRAREGRWPRWAEIERQFPCIGEWLDGQRAGMNQKGAA